MLGLRLRHLEFIVIHVCFQKVGLQRQIQLHDFEQGKNEIWRVQDD